LEGGGTQWNPLVPEPNLSGDDVACKLLEGCPFRLDERSARERLLRVVDVGDSVPVERPLRAV